MIGKIRINDSFIEIPIDMNNPKILKSNLSFCNKCSVIMLIGNKNISPDIVPKKVEI